MSKQVDTVLQVFTGAPQTFQSPNDNNIETFNNVISEVSTILMKSKGTDMMQSGVCSVKQRADYGYDVLPRSTDKITEKRQENNLAHYENRRPTVIIIG